MKSNNRQSENSSFTKAIKISRYIFGISAIYGILILTPQLFRETAFSAKDVPLDHPEFFYGFFLLAIAFQILFIVISTDPIKYRATMIPCFIEKSGHAISCIVLFAKHRLARDMFLVSLGDAVMLLLFLYCYMITAPRRRTLHSTKEPWIDQLDPLLYDSASML